MVDMTHAERRERREFMAKDAQGGMVPSDIARKYGVCQATVFDALGQANLTRKELKAQRRKRIVEEVREGASINDVAKKHNLTVQTIRAYCAEMGVKPNVTQLSVSTYRAISLILRGVKPIDIAKKLGVSRQNIHRIVDAFKEHDCDILEIGQKLKGNADAKSSTA